MLTSNSEMYYSFKHKQSKGLLGGGVPPCSADSWSLLCLRREGKEREEEDREGRKERGERDLFSEMFVFMCALEYNRQDFLVLLYRLISRSQKGLGEREGAGPETLHTTCSLSSLVGVEQMLGSRTVSTWAGNMH